MQLASETRRLAELDSQDEALPKTIDSGRFEVSKLHPVGSGFMSRVFRGYDREGQKEVAIKLECLNQPPFTLAQEAEVLKSLHGPQRSRRTIRGMQGVIKVFFHGTEGLYDCLVMEQLGRSLGTLLDFCGGKFGYETVVLLGQQLLLRVEYLHSRGVVHRNICPSSFVMGVKDRVHHVYMTGAECASRFWKKGEVKNGHIRKTHKHELVGDPQFASLRAHTGVAQSRRDDVEALGHMLVYFLRGDLPWSDFRKKYEIAVKKADTDLHELCSHHNSLPLRDYLEYARGLRFRERPAYESLHTLFRDMRQHLPVEDHDLEWLANHNFVDVTLEPVEYNVSMEHPDQAMYHLRAGFCLCGRHGTAE
mmetsp:Transcript_14361/g.26404  ORF Transcript_14361/g.26404 Transcript_14361/m.26404 type:complete len:363 (+) Transcript_14361:24-1112(+)